ncbi:unnamed protein product [Musa textilis]
MANKTMIIAILNKSYMEKNGMFNLFLQSFREGEGTWFLIKHLSFVAVNQMSFNQCCALGLNCYKLVMEGVDFSEVVFYMSDDFIEMMWRRKLFLGDVLKHGYSFILTREDLQMSSDFYNGRPFDDSNFFNTGFYFVTPNNKTTALFDEWYASKHNFTCMNDQEAC